MGLLLQGSTPCSICGQVIEAGVPAVVLPAFVWNDADALLPFNDASMHRTCFEAHPLRVQVEAALEELNRKTGPGRRKCAVCGSEVLDPDDYLMVPRLTDDVTSPAHRFNYTHLHRSQVREWRELGDLERILEQFDTAGGWEGSVLRELLQQLRQLSA
ncbi:hypothetical protein [Corallococcus sicarius]|uniref:Uncharacterized protein n=1 Tax=Corallococcus sicarius TaxID=2316726 RepID=A0A3A8MWX5_9BACT|nr:hypothetical protein [Corallococcus sicarius]RKH33235.1 hypothetical protein D7X12_36310 [Corallococcus sicarius]